MVSDRPDPSDFTGGTQKSTGEEVEEAAEALEPSDDPDGPFWTAKRKVKNLASGFPSYGSSGSGGNGNGDNGNGYDDDPDQPEDESKRLFLYAIGALGLGGAGAFAADGADGEIDGRFEAFDGLFGGTPPTNETSTPTPEETPESTPIDEETPYDTEQPTDTPQETATPAETATPEATANPDSETIYFESLTDLPDEACYRNEGGVSGYFAADDIENALGESVTSGLNPSAGDIAYDVDFRDSDGDGQADSYVVQLAGTDSQNDLTVEQAETLFEELDVDGSYC